MEPKLSPTSENAIFFVTTDWQSVDTRGTHKESIQVVYCLVMCPTILLYFCLVFLYDRLKLSVDSNSSLNLTTVTSATTRSVSWTTPSTAVVYPRTAAPPKSPTTPPVAAVMTTPTMKHLLCPRSPLGEIQIRAASSPPPIATASTLTMRKTKTPVRPSQKHPPLSSPTATALQTACQISPSMSLNKIPRVS